MERKTLLDALHPQHLEVINELEITYPYTIARIKMELENTNYIIDLKFGIILELESFLKLNFKNNAEIYNLFNLD